MRLHSESGGVPLSGAGAFDLFDAGDGGFGAGDGKPLVISTSMAGHSLDVFHLPARLSSMNDSASATRCAPTVVLILGNRASIRFRARIETVTSPVPNSCPILRAPAVTHGCSRSAFSFAYKEKA